MAKTFGILGQSAPAAATLAAAYTVPAGKHATARVLVCNRAGDTNFRVALSPLNAAIANQHYIAYGQPLAAGDSTSSVPFTVQATDTVRVYSSSGSVSFTVTGIEDDNEDSLD
jgi:hypothetical protein